MNYRKPIIFAGLYPTRSKIPAYLKEIKRIEKLLSGLQSRMSSKLMTL